MINFLLTKQGIPYKLNQLERFYNMITKFVADSDNSKISPKEHKVSATYTSIKASCPTTCQLRNEGACYAMGGPIAIIMRNLDKESSQYSANEVADEEYKLIVNSFNGKEIPQDGAKGGRDLRLHVFGDSTTVYAAQKLSAAADHWKNRNGGTVWTYTHAWENVHRSNWGNNVSILASVDNSVDGIKAIKQGYAPARIVGTHQNHKMVVEHGIRWIPCPEQTNGINCTKCRLCLNADNLMQKGMGIQFAAHGIGTKKIKRRLNVI